MGQDQDAPLITLVTWPREGLTTTGGVPAGVEVRPIWTTSTMCVRERALKIYGSREKGTSFTILPELDLSPYRKFSLFLNMSVVMRWWIPIHGWVDNMDFYFIFMFVHGCSLNDANVKEWKSELNQLAWMFIIL